MTAARDTFPEPVFIGGSARSGTHAMGRLVAAHPRYHRIRVEARFHASNRGLPDLLADRVRIDQFLETCRGHWWKRGLRQGRGLQVVADRDQLESALAEFEATFDDDPWEASRRLVRAVLDPAAEREGKPSWAEVTGSNIQSAPTLHRLFPRAKFINMVRDGRAVAAGILRKTDMTDDPMRALRHWEQRIRSADAAIRALPEGAVLVMPLDDLAARDREGSYRRLVGFLEMDDDAPMRRYFDRKISPEAAHVGRWRQRIPPPDARRIDRRYRRLVRRLHREGISWVPAPEDGGIRLGRLRVPTLGRS
jgi:hypothetical protein